MRIRSQTPAGGNIVVSSRIGGANPGTRELLPTLEQQVANVFASLRSNVEAYDEGEDRYTFCADANIRIALCNMLFFKVPESNLQTVVTSTPTGALGRRRWPISI